jgi:beta-galactosidase
LKCSVRAHRDGSVRIRSLQILQARDTEGSEEHRIQHLQQWTVNPGGRIALNNEIRIGAGLHDLPRVGIRFETVRGFERLAWFGRGPHENYWDRKTGAPMGRHESSVDAQYHRYVVPKEETGLLVGGVRPFEFGVSHYSGQDLYAAEHINELRARPETHVELDVHQRGVGTGACGPDTLPRFRIRTGLHRLGLWLACFDPKRTDPGRLAGQIGSDTKFMGQLR